MFNAKRMSPAELKFVQAYVRVLRKDYWLLKTTIALMDPDALGLKDIVTAAKLARSLQDLHTQFEDNLNNCEKLQPFRRAKMSTAPTLDELGDLFSLSFFKLVTTIKDKKKSTKIDDGWFSGEPNAWHATVSKMQSYKKDFGDVDMTDSMNAIAKLFANWLPQLDFDKAPPPPDVPINFWPKDLLDATLDDDDEDDYDEDDEWYDVEDDED